MNKRDQDCFVYKTNLANAQRVMNNQMSDYLLALDVKPEFDKYYESFRFGFGSNWMKPLFKQYFWWGYFAGYKRGIK